MHMVHNTEMESGLYGVDLNLLVALDALLLEEHVGRAAKRAGLSQSAMSHTLRRLREVFDDRLLVRSGGRMQPTARAAQLRPILRTCLEQLEHAVLAPPAFDPQSSRRRFRLACESYFSAVLLPPLVALLRERAPHVELALVHPGDPVEQLRDDDVDLFFGIDSARPDLEREVLFRDDSACLLRSNHPCVRQRLSLRRYVESPHVVVSVGSPGPTVVDRLLAERGLKRQVALRVNDFLAAPLAVATSDLLFTCPARLATMFAGTHGLRSVSLPIEIPSFDYAVFWLASRGDDPGQAWLLAQLRQACS